MTASNSRAQIPIVIIADRWDLFTLVTGSSSKSTAARCLMVDAGTESTWIGATVLEAIQDWAAQEGSPISVGERADHYALYMPHFRWISQRPWMKTFSPKRAISNCSAHTLWKHGSYLSQAAPDVTARGRLSSAVLP